MFLTVGVVRREFKECDEDEIKRFLEDSEPVNTRRSTKSSVNKYRKWKEWRKKTYPSVPTPPELECNDPRKLAIYYGAQLRNIYDLDSKS